MYNIHPTLLSDSVFRSSVLTYFGTYKQSDSILTCGWLSYIPCLIWLIFSCKIHQIQRVVLDSLQNWSGYFGEFWTLQNFLICFDTDSQFYEMRHNNFLQRKIARIYIGQLLMDLLLLLAVASLPFTGVLFDVVIYDSAVGRNKDHITVTRLFQCVLRWVVGFSVIVSQWAEHLSTENILYTWGS